MKNLAIFFAFLSLAGTTGFAHADYDLAATSNCLACHAVEKRKYGPTFKDVAAKYADDPKAEKRLAKKIKAGGTGVWGQDIMPAQPNLSKANALILSKYILSLK